MNNMINMIEGLLSPNNILHGLQVPPCKRALAIQEAKSFTQLIYNSIYDDLLWFHLFWSNFELFLSFYAKVTQSVISLSQGIRTHCNFQTAALISLQPNKHLLIPFPVFEAHRDRSILVLANTWKQISFIYPMQLYK